MNTYVFYSSEIYFYLKLSALLLCSVFLIFYFNFNKKSLNLLAKELAWNALDVWAGGAEWPCDILPCNTRILSI